MKAFIWIVIILGVLFGGYALYESTTAPKKSLSELAKETDVPDAGEDDDLPEPTQSGKKMSFESFLAYDKGPYQCSVTDFLSDFESKGVVYTSNGKLRADLSTIAEGRTLSTSVILKDGFSYLWMPPSTNGFKMQVIKESNLPEGGENKGSNYSWGPARVGEYDCQPWTEDAAKFALPSSVIFRELSEGAR